MELGDVYLRHLMGVAYQVPISFKKGHCPLEHLLPGKLGKFKDDDNETVSIPHDIPELVRLVQELADYEKMSDGPQACYWCKRITYE